MQVGKSILLICFVGLIFLLLLTLVMLSNNTFPLINSYQFVPKYKVYQTNTYPPGQVNKDGTYTYFYAESKIENIETKYFFLRSYIVLKIRASVGMGFSDQITYIPIPSNLASSDKLQLLPSQLRRYKGKLISLNVLFLNHKRDLSYSFLDVRAWEIKSLQ